MRKIWIEFFILLMKESFTQAENKVIYIGSFFFSSPSSLQLWVLKRRHQVTSSDKLAFFHAFLRGFLSTISRPFFHLKILYNFFVITRQNINWIYYNTKQIIASRRGVVCGKVCGVVWCVVCGMVWCVMLGCRNLLLPRNSSLYSSFPSPCFSFFFFLPLPAPTTLSLVPVSSFYGPPPSLLSFLFSFNFPF